MCFLKRCLWTKQKKNGYKSDPHSTWQSKYSTKTQVMIRNRIQLLFGMEVSSGQDEQIKVSSFWWAERNRAAVCLMRHVWCLSSGYNPWRWIIWTQDTLLSRHEVLWAEVDPSQVPQFSALLGVAFPSCTRPGCIVIMNDFVQQPIDQSR